VTLEEAERFIHRDSNKFCLSREFESSSSEFNWLSRAEQRWSEQRWCCCGYPAAHCGREQPEPQAVGRRRPEERQRRTACREIAWTARANCMPAGVPEFLLHAGGAESMYMIQAPKEVLMIHQADNQTRHIYMDVPHSAHPTPSWYGESVGHYDGDQLVVDTVGFNDRTFLDNHYDLPHTTQLHVMERFKLLDKGRTLQASFTVEDPGAFNAPWSVMVRYQHARTPATLFEEPCSENNFENLSNIGVFVATVPSVLNFTSISCSTVENTSQVIF
jgi:hypothetical protein